MSRTSIDRILNRAGKVAGKVLGDLCVNYRPLDYINPVQPKNMLVAKHAAFLLSENFNKTVDYNFELFNVEVDGTDVLPGDIFTNAESMYVIVSSRSMEAIQAILVNEYLSIKRPVYADSGSGFGATTTDVAVNLPANVLSVSGGNAAAGMPTRAGSKGSFKEYKIRTYFSDDLLKIGDQVIDSNGNKSVINAIDFSSTAGYTLTTQEVK